VVQYTENSDSILFVTLPALLAACWVKISVLACITTEDKSYCLVLLELVAAFSVA